MNKNKLLESAKSLEKQAHKLLEEAKNNRELVLESEEDNEERDFNEWIRIKSVIETFYMDTTLCYYLHPYDNSAEVEYISDSYFNIEINYFSKYKKSKRDWRVLARAFEHIAYSKNPWETYQKWIYFIKEAKKELEIHQEYNWATIESSEKGYCRCYIVLWKERPVETLSGAGWNVVYGYKKSNKETFLTSCDIGNDFGKEASEYRISRRELFGEEK